MVVSITSLYAVIWDEVVLKKVRKVMAFFDVIFHDLYCFFSLFEILEVHLTF